MNTRAAEMDNSITYTNAAGQTVTAVPGQPGTVTTGRPERVEIAPRSVDDVFRCIDTLDDQGGDL